MMCVPHHIAHVDESSGLRYLLPELERERTEGVVVESRHNGDVHDDKVVSWLRKSKEITGRLRVDHVHKEDEALLWLADAFVSAYTSARVLEWAS